MTQTTLFPIWVNLLGRIYNYYHHFITHIIYPSCAARARVYVIGAGVHIHVYVYICLWTKSFLNRTLAINSPFQTFTVGFLVEFID